MKKVIGRKGERARGDRRQATGDRRQAKGAKWAKWIVGIVVAIPCLSTINVVCMREGEVKVTMFMIHRALETWKKNEPYSRDYRWVSYEQINPSLTRAVIASEDNLFVTHHGFSQKGIEKAIKERKTKGKVKHGGSTISQQTAKGKQQACKKEKKL